MLAPRLLAFPDFTPSFILTSISCVTSARLLPFTLQKNVQLILVHQRHPQSLSDILRSDGRRSPQADSRVTEAY